MLDNGTLKTTKNRRNGGWCCSSLGADRAHHRAYARIVLPAPGSNQTPARRHALRDGAAASGCAPMLAYAAGETTGASPERLLHRRGRGVIHAYSWRTMICPARTTTCFARKPTVHVEFGRSHALLASDALQALAFELVSVHRLADSPDQQLKMLQIFGHACSSHGMAGARPSTWPTSASRFPCRNSNTCILKMER